MKGSNTDLLSESCINLALAILTSQLFDDAKYGLLLL